MRPRRTEPDPALLRPATVTAFAPAKINLALHVTGRRGDGYHLLDSLVAFADIGDRITVAPADAMALTVTGPRAGGVPADARNLCWRAAERFGVPARIVLEKHLPAAAGIGGGSSDAAAVLRALQTLSGRPLPFDPVALGADIPVCLHARSARMSGIGETVAPVAMPRFPALLVNPGVEVPTPAVFAALHARQNPAMQDPPGPAAAERWLDWLASQRNDLEAPAIRLAPAIGAVLDALSRARLARMSGSGATCFALYDDSAAALDDAHRLQERHPDWWIAPCTLG